MSGLPIHNFNVCKMQSIGPVLATTREIEFDDSAMSANTKTAYTQITAATAEEINWIVLTIKQTVQASNAVNMMFDIAIGGAGSEIDILPNLIYQWQNATPGFGTISIPITIPAGSRLSFRRQAFGVGAGNAFSLSIYGFTGNFCHVTGYDAMGIDTTNGRGTGLNLSGVANTFGSWTEIISATVRDYVGFFVVLDCMLSLTTSRHIFQMAIGASGSEIVLLTDMFYHFDNAGAGSWFGFIPIFIPAGTRLAARVQTHDASAFNPNFSLLGAIG